MGYKSTLATQGINLGNQFSDLTESSTACTVMCWVKDEAAQNNKKYLQQESTDVGDNACIWLIDSAGTNNIFEVLFRTTAAYVQVVDSGGAHSLNVWYHIAGVYDQTRGIYLYVNGVEAGSTATNKGTSLYTVIESNAKFIINNNALVTPSSAAICSLFDVRYYNRALSITEISHIYYSKGNDGITTNLQGRWIVNEGNLNANITGANGVIDISGNNRTGTGFNNPTYVEVPMRLLR